MIFRTRLFNLISGRNLLASRKSQITAPSDVVLYAVRLRSVTIIAVVSPSLAPAEYVDSTNVIRLSCIT